MLTNTNIKTPITNKVDRVDLSNIKDLIRTQHMKSQQKNVTLNVEIDDGIYQCMQDYLSSNNQWNTNAVINASLSLFLIQNHSSIEAADYKACSQKYLRSLCSVPRQYFQN